VGLVIVATVGNAAEHSTAAMMARKDKMDLALNIAVRSAAIARPLSLSYGTPSCIKSDPRFAYPSPSGR
jgi:hypothetical protein